jgi:hypothetical protein
MLRYPCQEELLNGVRTMKKALLLMIAGTLAASAAPGSTPRAFASGSSDVQRSGICGSHPWTLELSHDDGRIEADYELHNVTVGSTWRVVMKDNGVRFFRGTRTARSDRYIEVDRYTRNRAGTDRITVHAANVATGQLCAGAASIS